MLTSLTPSLTYEGGIGSETCAQWSGRARSTCVHAFAPIPTASGDYVGIVGHLASIPAGGTVNFKVGYRLM